LLFHFFNHFLPCTLGTNNIGTILDEALAHHGVLADVTEEALVVPGQSLKSDKLCATKATFTSDRLAAGGTALGKQFAKAVGAVRFVIARGEPLACQRLLTVCASEALSMPRIVTVGDTSLGDNLAALDTLGGKLLLVALGTVDIVLLGDEGLCANWVLASAADETLLVPLAGLVFHFLHTCFKNIPTAITTSGELSIIARSAVDSVSFGSKLLVNKTGPALVAQEASFMPMLLLVGEVLGVNPNNFAAFIAVICKYVFITFNAVWVVIPQDVPVTGKAVVAMMAKHGFNF